MQPKRILAKLPAEEGCCAVIYVLDEEGRHVWAETDHGKRLMVRAIPLGFIGFVPIDPFEALAVLSGIGCSPIWIPFDKEGAEIKGPIDYLMPGETIQDWGAKSLADEAARIR